jgi:hypothetical protein
MSKKMWVWAVIIAILVAGAAFWGGMTYAQSQRTSTAASRFGAAGTAFAGRGGAGFAAGGAGGGTVGTVIQVGNGTFTVQLPSSTSTTATTGTKLVLFDDATQVQELETVPTSNIQVGQTVTVTGSANSDGSITATSVMVRPSTTRSGSTGSTATPTTGQ